MQIGNRVSAFIPEIYRSLIGEVTGSEKSSLLFVETDMPRRVSRGMEYPNGPPP